MKYQQKKVPQFVFRAYDIRGTIGDDLDEDSFYSIGLAIACTMVKINRQKIFLAFDGRLTSHSLAIALKQGLLDSGIDVIELGAVSTPIMYYATCTQDIDCGLIVTGSHNPANYNGIKIVLRGSALVQDDMDILYSLVDKGSRIIGCGIESTLDIREEYTRRITSDIQIKRPLKVVVDCGNGIAGPIIPKVLEDLGCEVISLYCDVDGRFPHHHPDPAVEENLTDLKQSVLMHHADIGLAFDGDADRIGVITNSAETICPDRLMMLFVREVLREHHGATVVFDVKCSRNLERVIIASGGVAKMCPCGHSIVKRIMKEEHAILAGETSGHIFFKDRWYGFDDALYSACRLLEIISLSDLSTSHLFESIPSSINTSELKIAIPDEEKFLFIQRFIEEAEFNGGRFITLDGLRVEFAKGWGLLRASNTTPCIVARFEAEDIDTLHYIQDLFKNQIVRLNAKLELPF